MVLVVQTGVIRHLENLELLDRLGSLEQTLVHLIYSIKVMDRQALGEPEDQVEHIQVGLGTVEAAVEEVEEVDMEEKAEKAEKAELLLVVAQLILVVAEAEEDMEQMAGMEETLSRSIKLGLRMDLVAEAEEVGMGITGKRPRHPEIRISQMAEAAEEDMDQMDMELVGMVDRKSKKEQTAFVLFVGQ